MKIVKNVNGINIITLTKEIGEVFNKWKIKKMNEKNMRSDGR